MRLIEYLLKVNNVPRSMSGLSLGVTYKNFDFSMLMNASTGGTAYLYTYPSSKINLERWTAENKNARIPAAHSTTNNTVVTDEDVDAILLRSVDGGDGIYGGDVVSIWKYYKNQNDIQEIVTTHPMADLLWYNPDKKHGVTLGARFCFCGK